MLKNRSFTLTPILLCLILSLAGCLVLNPGPRPTIAPIDSNSVSFDGLDAPVAIAPGTPIPFDSDVKPAADPDIVALSEAVSRQQLIAYVQTLSGFNTRNSFSNTRSDTEGIGATRRWIKSEFERVGNGNLVIEMQRFPLTYEGLTQEQENIVATLPGVSGYPGALVIGAHYDSRVGESAVDGASYSPSANDNASGVAMLLELARLLSSRRWNQTIIFVAFASEEQGTAGSRSFVNQSVLDSRQIDWAISNDSVGAHVDIPQRSVRLFAPNQEFSESGAAARYISYLADIYVDGLDVKVLNTLDREGRYGDHREFIKAKIGAVRLIELVEDENRLNSASDTWDKIDYNYLADVTKINLVSAANWIGSPKPPVRPTVSQMAEPGTYLVSWRPDPQAAAYAVAFRPMNQTTYPTFRMVAADGEAIFTDLDPKITYGVSLAPVTRSGKMGGFSPEMIVP